MDFENSTSTKIRAAESAQKSAEAGLMNMECQVTELKKKLDWEYTYGSQLRVKNSQLKDAITEAQAKVQKAEEEAQSYYDQGFTEAADSLQSQLKDECNKFFIQGWHMALDKAEVNDASELMMHLMIKGSLKIVLFSSTSNCSLRLLITDLNWMA